jgi:hypothetical protein
MIGENTDRMDGVDNMDEVDNHSRGWLCYILIIRVGSKAVHPTDDYIMLPFQGEKG